MEKDFDELILEESILNSELILQENFITNFFKNLFKSDVDKSLEKIEHLLVDKSMKANGPIIQKNHPDCHFKNFTSDEADAINWHVNSINKDPENNFIGLFNMKGYKFVMYFENNNTHIKRVDLVMCKNNEKRILYYPLPVFL